MAKNCNFCPPLDLSPPPAPSAQRGDNAHTLLKYCPKNKDGR